MQRTSKLLAIPAVWCPAPAVVLVWLAFAAVPAAAIAAQAPEPTTSTRETALKAFTDRVNQYTALKKEVAAGLSKVKTGDVATGKAEAHVDTLAVRIQQARKDAKPGDVFGDAAPYFLRIIERDSRTRGTGDASASMQEVPAKSPPAVNAVYPEKAALATVPPLILVNLPRLPDGLEYRFMGRDLILRDREANIIVDFVPGAVPAVKK